MSTIECPHPGVEKTNVRVPWTDTDIRFCPVCATVLMQRVEDGRRTAAHLERAKQEIVADAAIKTRGAL